MEVTPGPHASFFFSSLPPFLVILLILWPMFLSLCPIYNKRSKERNKGNKEEREEEGEGEQRKEEGKV